MPKNEMIEKINTILDELSIKHHALFWDENLFGKKPKVYAVYDEENSVSTVASNNEDEVLSERCTITFFCHRSVYDDSKYRDLKRKCSKTFLTAGFLISNGFENYERDTGYFRFDLEIEKESEEI